MQNSNPDLTRNPRMDVRSAVVAVAPVVVLGYLMVTRPPAHWGAVEIVGLVLTVFGLVMQVIARVQLGSSFSVTAQAKQLATHGLYSKIRNPIYVSALFVIVGLAMMYRLERYLWVLIVLIPSQMWRAHKEAQVLEAAFGDEYRRYRAGTWF
jgi:protein-S-isoprenylcysteine O-methyltransferase Ste14